MNGKQIRVGSADERTELVQRLTGQRYEVLLETERQTHLALPRVMYRDIPMALLLTLCGIIPGFVYLFYLQFGPRRQVIITITG